MATECRMRFLRVAKIYVHIVRFRLSRRYRIHHVWLELSLVTITTVQPPVFAPVFALDVPDVGLTRVGQYRQHGRFSIFC